MATHSGVLAWKIPGTGEPGGLPSMRHDSSDLAAESEIKPQNIFFFFFRNYSYLDRHLLVAREKCNF